MLSRTGEQCFLVFATVSVVCGYLSCCLVVPSFVGLTFAVVVFLFSTRDLGRMRAGLMEPQGLRADRRHG